MVLYLECLIVIPLENRCKMSIFIDNITNELPLATKIRAAIDKTLDSTVDLVNNHFEYTKPNIVECGNYATLLPPDTSMAFVNEANNALKELCKSEFARRCGLLITKSISLESLESTQSNVPDSWTKWRVKIVVDYFVDGSTISTSGAATMYVDAEMVYEKIIYNEPHWP